MLTLDHFELDKNHKKLIELYSIKHFISLSIS
jgi:hypothetical protein